MATIDELLSNTSSGPTNRVGTLESVFSGVASGPFVRSSFKAGLLLRKTLDPNNNEVLPGAYVKVSDKIFENRHHLSPVAGEANQ